MGEYTMGKVLTFSESYRKKRYRKAVTVDDQKKVIDLGQKINARKRAELFTEYADALLQVEHQCRRLIRKRRFDSPHSESLARRAVNIFDEYTADILSFLKKTDATLTLFFYFGVIDYAAEQVLQAINAFRSLPYEYTYEVSDAVHHLELSLKELRCALEPVFAADGGTLPATVYLV